MNSYLEGSLEGLPLAAVFRFLVQQKKEGRVRVGGPDRSAEFHLRSGPRFAARCDDPAFDIPALLVRRAVISEPEAAQLDAEMKASGGALEDSQRYSTEELRNFAHLEAREILVEALTWESGQFRWTDEQTMPAGLHLFDLNVDEAEKEAARRGAEAIDGSVPSDETRFRVTPHNGGSSVRIAAEELAMLLEMGSGASFGELASGAEGDRTRIARMLHRLRVRGLVEWDEGAEIAAEAIEPPRAEKVHPHEEVQAPPAQISPPAEDSSPEADPFDSTPATSPDQDVWQVSHEPQQHVPPRQASPDATLSHAPLSDTRSDSELPFAIITLDDETKTSYPLLDDQNSIGRGEHNSIRIAHGSISGMHARIDRTAEGYRLHDLKSRNGTFLNGDRITETALLNNNDRIRLGTVYMTFSVAAELEPSATVMTRIPTP